MEDMASILLILQNILYSVISHPAFIVIGIVLCLILFVKLYCKLTMGICNVDQDMAEKTVLITGATAGIGKATAMDMAKRNARVILACRNIEKANKVAEDIKLATGNENVLVKWLDLSSFESVRMCAKSVLETEKKLHVLINNAGIIGMPREITADGCDLTMQSNHLGHFLLTLLLLELIKSSSPSRIINVSSEAHHFAKFDINDLNNERNLHSFRVYANSKIAQIYFTRELAKRLEGTGVIVNALDPGAVQTDVLNHTKDYFYIMSRIHFFIIGKTPEEGAQTTVQLAIDPLLKETTGKYFRDCKEVKISEAAKDQETAKQLVELSEKIVGLSF